MIKYYQILSNIIKHYQILSNIIKYHQILSKVEEGISGGGGRDGDTQHLLSLSSSRYPGYDDIVI